MVLAMMQRPRDGGDIAFNLLGGYPENMISGADTLIAPVPDGVWFKFQGKDYINMKRSNKQLRELADQSAARLGEKVHHARAIITSNRTTLREQGILHDCARCRAAVDQAVAEIDRNGTEFLILQMWWLNVRN